MEIYKQRLSLGGVPRWESDSFVPNNLFSDLSTFRRVVDLRTIITAVKGFLNPAWVTV